MQDSNVQSKNKGQVKTNADTHVGAIVSNSALFVGSAIPVAIGLWAAACFVGGLMTGGPLAMLQGFVSAVTGL